MTALVVKTVTVRLPAELHWAVKVRAAERGDSLEGIARAAFVAYLEDGLAAGAAGEPVSRDSGGAPRSAPAASSFQPDFKKTK